VPRVRRLSRTAPALELLAATLPRLRLGLSDAAARTVAYEVFEKLGFGAVSVTDRAQVLAFVGAGADHHGPGDRPIRPVFEALAAGEVLVAPLALRRSSSSRSSRTRSSTARRSGRCTCARACAAAGCS
jgi:LytS/YehU family sensor histidine kinase